MGKGIREDEAYVDPSEGQKRTRPTYANQFKTVAQRQNLEQQSDGSYLIDSVVTPGLRHKLDSQMRETVPNHHGKYGTVQQKPALDHKIQFANLQEQYDQLVTAERDKATNGLKRRSSFDLGQAFERAVADPDNLSIKTHSEHVNTGGSLRRGQFSQQEQNAARQLIESHYDTNNEHSQEWSQNNWGRPKWATPLPNTSNEPTRRSTRIKRTHNGIQKAPKPPKVRASDIRKAQQQKTGNLSPLTPHVSRYVLRATRSSTLQPKGYQPITKK